MHTFVQLHTIPQELSFTNMERRYAAQCVAWVLNQAVVSLAVVGSPTRVAYSVTVGLVGIIGSRLYGPGSPE